MEKLVEQWKRIKNCTISEILIHGRNYLVGNVATKALGLISMPIFTRLLSREDYGIVAVYTAMAGLAVTLTTLNVTDGISRYYYEDKRNDFGAFLSSVLQMAAAFQIPIIVALLIWPNVITNLIGLPSSVAYFIVIALLHGVLFKVFRQINISRRNSREFVQVSVSEGYVGFGLSWGLLAVMPKTGFLLRIAGVAIVQCLSAIWMAIRTSSYVNWQRPRWEHIRYSLYFSLPRMPYVLSGLILGQSDRIMLANISGLEAAGVYSVGYSVGALSLIVITAITPALIPNFYQLMNDGKTGVVDKINRQISWLICSACTGLMLCGGFILQFLSDEQFHDGARVVPAVVMGYIFYAQAGVYNRFCGYYKRTVLQSLGALLAAAANILLNLWWLPIFGMVAAAYTTLISYGIQATITWLLTKRFVKGHVTPLVPLLKPLSVALGVLVIIEGDSIWRIVAS